MFRSFIVFLQVTSSVDAYAISCITCQGSSSCRLIFPLFAFVVRLVLSLVTLLSLRLIRVQVFFSSLALYPTLDAVSALLIAAFCCFTSWKWRIYWKWIIHKQRQACKLLTERWSRIKDEYWNLPCKIWIYYVQAFNTMKQI
jgi:hypothetical protein